MSQFSFTSDLNTAVHAFINTMLKSDPACYEQTKLFLEQRSSIRDSLKNDRGMSESEEFKYTISMPELLGCYVFKQFPEILTSKKNMYSFMRAFPQFSIPADPDKTKFI